MIVRDRHLWGLAVAGTGVGAAGGLLAQGHLPGTRIRQGEETAIAGMGVGSLLLAPLRRWEASVGPFRDRHVVDGAEQVSRTTVSLHRGPKSALAAMAIGSVGAGVMFAGFASWIRATPGASPAAS